MNVFLSALYRQATRIDFGDLQIWLMFDSRDGIRLSQNQNMKKLGFFLGNGGECGGRGVWGGRVIHHPNFFLPGDSLSMICFLHESIQFLEEKKRHISKKKKNFTQCSHGLAVVKVVVYQTILQHSILLKALISCRSQVWALGVFLTKEWFTLKSYFTCQNIVLLVVHAILDCNLCKV